MRPGFCRRLLQSITLAEIAFATVALIGVIIAVLRLEDRYTETGCEFAGLWRPIEAIETMMPNLADLRPEPGHCVSPN